MRRGGSGPVSGSESGTCCWAESWSWLEGGGSMGECGGEGERGWESSVKSRPRENEGASQCAMRERERERWSTRRWI